MSQSVDLCVFSVCLFVCMISNQGTSKNHVICLKLSVNTKPCGIKRCARCIKQGASDTKLPRLGKFRSIISLSKITLDVVCPHIQLKKQGNKKSNITDGEGEGGLLKIWKR